MSDLVILENERLRVVVTPEQGAGQLALYVSRGGAWLPIMPDARTTDLIWCNWLMVPYSNRIENGRFTFDGKEYQLANAEKHALHGDGRNHPWRIEDRSDTYVRLDLRSNDFADFNWPWKIETRAEYEVMGSTFSMRAWLWNRDTTPMPAGLGWHPYFSRTLTRDGEPVLMQMNAHGVYPDANDNRIPSGPAQPLPPNIDFSRETEVAPGNFFDNCCTGYDGAGTIRWPESGVRLRFQCTPEYTHLVIFNPTGKPYFAAEPVTNATNGVNLLAQGDPTAGTVPLAPGECLSARFDIIVETE